MSALDLDAKIAAGFRARLEAQRKDFKRDAQREYRHRFLVLGYVLRRIEGHWDWYLLPHTYQEHDRFRECPSEWWRAHRITPEIKKSLRRHP